MEKKYLFVANWKMYAPFNQAIEFATTHYDAMVKLTKDSNHQIVLCPSFESLYPLIEMFKSTPVEIGAQSCSRHTNGAFTGQVSAQSLQDIGCTYGIVGHSESRTEWNETDEMIEQKCIHLLDYDIIPIFCIGETEEEHKQGQTLKVLERQLKPLFESICSRTIVHPYLTIYVAYEPIWAIGTGKAVSADHLETICSWLRKHIDQQCPSPRSSNTKQTTSNGTSVLQWKLMYGGSVSPQNIANMKKIDEIDGFLVGKASLDFQKFEKIVK